MFFSLCSSTRLSLCILAGFRFSHICFSSCFPSYFNLFSNSRKIACVSSHISVILYLSLVIFSYILFSSNIPIYSLIYLSLFFFILPPLFPIYSFLTISFFFLFIFLVTKYRKITGILFFTLCNRITFIKCKQTDELLFIYFCGWNKQISKFVTHLFLTSLYKHYKKRYKTFFYMN